MNRNQKRLSRCLSLQVYYAWIISESHPKDILNHLKNLTFDEIEEILSINENFDDENLVISKDIIEYAFKLIESTISKCDEIDIFIESKLKNWDLKRIALIDKLILRLSINEMYYFDDVPPKVSIVEGVEIAKIFGNNQSSAFVNGVLDSIYNDYKKNNRLKIS